MTIDWVPITGAMIGLGLVVALNVNTGSTRMGETTRDTLAGAEVVAVITQPRTPAQNPPANDLPPPVWNDDLPPLPPYNPGVGDGHGNAPPAGNGNGNASGCQGIPGVSCSGLGDGTNPGQGSGNNNAGDTPGGTGVNNPGGSNASGGSSGGGGGGGAGAAPASGVPETINYTFPTRVVPADWGDWRDTTNWFDLQHITGGQPAAFEVWGDGNPAFNLNGTEQTAGFLQWGAQISMNTPPAPGTSNTAYIRVTTPNETWTAAYTITREGAAPPPPAPPPGPVATFTQHVDIPYYHSNTYQNWFTRPVEIPANEWNLLPYTVSGDGNPVVQSNTGGWLTEGTMRWNGVTLRFDTPPPGQTYTIVLEFGQHVGVYTFTRAAQP